MASRSQETRLSPSIVVRLVGTVTADAPGVNDELKMLKSLAVARLVMDTASVSPYRGRLYVAFLTAVDDRLQVMVRAERRRDWRQSQAGNFSPSLLAAARPCSYARP